MLDFMLKNSFYSCSGAEANSRVSLRTAEIMKSFSVVLRFAVVVLVSILITHLHADPV